MEHVIYPSLRGRPVFITGGASGIGACLVRAFSIQGALTAFVDINASGGNKLVEEISRISATPPFFQVCDVRDVSALQSAIGAAREVNGNLRVLINNAGDDKRHSLSDLAIMDWDENIAVNLRHMVFAAQTAVPQMRLAGGGSIINLSSICWKLPNSGVIAYSVSKAAVHALTRSLAKELGNEMIRVNTLTPGWVMTEKQKRLWVNAEAELTIDRMQSIPVRIEPDDIAAMALFLASDASRCCTAQEFIVDAGWI